GVMINRRGRRFVDEGEDGAMFTYAKYGRAILAEPGAKAYQIFDSQVVHLLEPRYATSEPITADTLEDLVAQLDIDDKAQAVRTLHEYNAAAKHAGDGFDPTRKDGLATSGLALEKTNWATMLEKPPYYAYSATGGITFTFGGLRVDENAQVIGTDWRDRPRSSSCRAVERRCRAAQQRLSVLHGARRPRRHLDQSVCRSSEGQSSVLHPRRD